LADIRILIDKLEKYSKEKEALRQIIGQGVYCPTCKAYTQVKTWKNVLNGKHEGEKKARFECGHTFFYFYVGEVD